MRYPNSLLNSSNIQIAFEARIKSKWEIKDGEGRGRSRDVDGRDEVTILVYPLFGAVSLVPDYVIIFLFNRA